MVFASTVFLFLFFPLTLLLYYNPLCRSRRCRNAVLLAVDFFLDRQRGDGDFNSTYLLSVYCWYSSLTLQSFNISS